MRRRSTLGAIALFLALGSALAQPLSSGGASSIASEGRATDAAPPATSTADLLDGATLSRPGEGLKAPIVEPWDVYAEPPIPVPVSQLTGYVSPLPNGRITQPFGFSPFGPVVVDGRRFHDGLDIATFCGDHIRAAHDGVVLAASRNFDPYAGWIGSLQPHIDHLNEKHLWYSLPITIVIDDGDGYRSLYAHLSAARVKPGQHVRAGQFIGYEGRTGFATGCHLHFGLFSPYETATMALRPDVVKRTKYPAFERAHVNPLLVLPRPWRSRPSPSATFLRAVR